MTTERERLIAWAKQLADPNWCLSVPKEAKDTITALLKELEPRTVTTAEELMALPAGSTVQDPAGIAWQKHDAGNDPLWHAAKHRTLRRDASALSERSPFTILHEGAA